MVFRGPFYIRPAVSEECVKGGMVDLPLTFVSVGMSV